MAPNDLNTAATDDGGEERSFESDPTRSLNATEPAEDSSVDDDPIERGRLRTGESVGRYIVLDDLGRGGMSIVYTAYDPKLDRRVALKLMRPDFGEHRDRAQARLLREAQAMARVAHPNVVRVYDVGVLGRRVYMAMELVEGQTLRDWISARSRGWREIVAVLARAGRGLAAAHEAGLVHLDVKPRNILVGDDGEVRMVDFGLARAPRTMDSMPSASAGGTKPLDDRITHAGTVMGTPGYMAPEQVFGTPPDARSDQFSFCVTVWEALFGTRPFRGSRLGAYRAALSEDIVEPDASARVPSRLRRVLERGLSLEPERRYASMRELLDALSVDPRRWWWRAGAAVAGSTAVVGVSWALARPPSDPCLDQAWRLEEIWSDERREQARSRLLSLDVQRDRPIADELVAELDGYAVAWADAAVEICRVAKAEGHDTLDALDVRQYCLERRRQSLRATVDLMLESGDRPDAQWNRVVAELPSVEPCRDMTSLYDVGRPPTDPTVARALAGIEGRIARVWVLVHMGRAEAALEQAEPIAEQAEAIGHAPVIADIKHAQSIALGFLDRAEESERLGFEVLWLADVEGMHRMRLVALSNLIHGIGVLGGRYVEAEHLARNALMIERELVGDPDLRSQILSNLASLETQNGRLDDARAHYEEALALRRTHGVKGDGLNMASTLVGLGATEHQLGESEKALSLFREAQRWVVQRYGPRHPAALVARENEATALHSLERYEEALEVLLHTRELHAQNDSRFGSAATLDAALGAVYIDLGRHAEAVEVLERARAQLHAERVRPLQLGIICGNLAVAYLEQDDAEAALEVAAEGFAIIGEQLGPAHVYTAWLEAMLAWAHVELDHAAEALAHAGAARKALEEADERGDGLVQPEFRAEASLVIARSLSTPLAHLDAADVARWGGGRSAHSWARQALEEADVGGRAVRSVRARARRWLEVIGPDPSAEAAPARVSKP